ncbi:MAG TPA: acetyl-CoA carboxylase biotin carboxylase subunit [Bacteroidetes bacterium]|nr:acetyl-CoA carboxylase biotin carboxylase subunit [Bacteroidota bacterium]
MAEPLFKKILIANRGEIALRILRTCKEMGIPTVAVYSSADRESLHVRFADEAVCIGPAPGKDSYLNIPNIIAAAEITGVTAIHPGYGFLAENAEFAQVCSDYGIKFIGPSPEAMNAMGDKASAKATMKKANVPVVPGSDGLLKNVEQAKKIGAKIGFPVLLKATAGGGGKGMRIVNEASEMEAAWDSARLEAGNAFGNDGMYLEKFILKPRHIEIQIIGDQYGNVSHLSERDCTIQRRHQKLVEESPSPAPFMTDKLRKRMGDAAIKAGKAVTYEGAGTVEFIVDESGKFYFMEMNTRIQVEHPVTEEVFNFDLIKEQIRAAAGIEVSGKSYFPKDIHSMEVRINAEDPSNNFRPSPGLITHFHKPGGHGIRVDTHAYAGYQIPPHYDSMIGKLIVTARTREEVIAKMRRALEEFIIEGIKTTIPFHQKLMDDPVFCSGDYSTNYLEENNITY